MVLAHPAKCIRNVKCTRRSPSKCKYLLSAVVIYASVENQYSGWAWADPPLRYHSPSVCAILDTTGLQWGEVTLERDRGTRGARPVKSLFYDRSAGSMATSKTGSASRFSGRNEIDFNWYQVAEVPSTSTRIPALYVARKADKRDPILFKCLGLPSVCRLRENSSHLQDCFLKWTLRSRIRDCIRNARDITIENAIEKVEKMQKTLSGEYTNWEGLNEKMSVIVASKSASCSFEVYLNDVTKK